MVKSYVKWAGYICLVTWTFLVLVLYLYINWANVNYSLKTYGILLNHEYTLLLFLIPSLVLVSVAVIIYLVKLFSSKRD